MKKTNSTVTLLIVLDGFGYSEEKKYNAIYHAATPHIDQWMHEYPHAILQAAGPAVGLPKGTIGNSEAGHLTLGAGRITQEPVTRINNAIDDGSFARNPTLLQALNRMDKNKTLHFIGLLSDASVHSHMKQLNALLDIAHQLGIKHLVVHPILDGRDVSPQSASKYLQQLEEKLKKIGGRIGVIQGRFNAMDRDNNWDRTEKSYRALTQPQQTPQCTDWKCLLNDYYEQNITDEFIPPTQLDPQLYIKDGDGVIFFNFRPDRARQLAASFVDPTFTAFKKKPLKLACFITPTEYSTALKTDALYRQDPLENTLKEVLVSQGKTIYSIAETEKYAHVTYFFGGGKEATLFNETRILIPSKKKKDYSQTPQMAAGEITQAVLTSLKTKPCDFYLINYSNADMVAHTGNFSATVQAVEYLDTQLGQLYTQVIEKMNGVMYVTADHGNAEVMYDEVEKQLKTSHTTNPVPFIMIRKDLQGKGNTKLPLTQLADVAPFILKNMKLPIPKEMQHNADIMKSNIL